MHPNSLRRLLTAAFVLITPAIARAQGMTAAPQSPQQPVPQPVPQTPQQPPAPAPGQPAAPWGAPQPLPAPPPPPASAIAPNGEYVAPLAQTTQPAYVPQSVALSGPRFIKDWEPRQPIPYGYHAENRARKGPIITGAVLFGVAYGYSALVASIGQDSAGSGTNQVGSLFIPVVGPFAQMFDSHSAVEDYFLIVDGVAQAVGVGLFVYGVTVPRPLLVRNDLAFAVTPVKLGRDGNGVGFIGRF